MCLMWLVQMLSDNEMPLSFRYIYDMEWLLVNIPAVRFRMNSDGKIQHIIIM